MLRLLKSIESKEKSSSLTADQLNQAASKRKSLKKGGTLAKMDREAESKHAEVRAKLLLLLVLVCSCEQYFLSFSDGLVVQVLYAELQFTSRDRRPSEYNERDQQLAQQALQDAEDPAVNYVDVDIKATVAAEAKQAAGSKTKAFSPPKEEPPKRKEKATNKNKPATQSKEPEEAGSILIATTLKNESSDEDGGCCVVQ